MGFYIDGHFAYRPKTIPIPAFPLKGKGFLRFAKPQQQSGMVFCTPGQHQFSAQGNPYIKAHAGKIADSSNHY